MSGTPGSLDWAGTATFGIGLIAPRAQRHHRTASSRTAALTTGMDQPVGAGAAIAVGLFAAVAFCVIELRVADPMVDIRLFGQRRSAGAISPG